MKTSFLLVVVVLMFIYFERERERKRKREFQAGSMLSAWSEVGLQLTNLEVMT